MRAVWLLSLVLAMWSLCVGTPATAAPTCSASASGLAFGTIQTPSNTAYDTTSTIGVTCTGDGTAADVRICPFIGSGTYGGAPGGPRQLGSNAARLAFDVFSTSGKTVRYPNDTTDATTPATTIAVPASGSASATITVYGRIPANQTAAATGSYATVLASGIYYGAVATFSDCATTAGRTQATFSIQATATNSPICSVSTSPVAFGAVAGLGAPVSAVGAIAVLCSAGTSYSVALDGGVNGGSSATTRKMANGASRVTYGLYRDAARSQGWYTSAGTTVAGSGSGSVQSIPVYGRTPAQSTPPNGTYADTVTVTLTY